MCSSLAAIESPIHPFFFHARNLDYPIEVLAGKNVIFHYKDKKCILVGFPGYIGALTATNYRGLTLSSHTAVVPSNQKGVPTGILYRMIIENARSIKDVHTILKKNKRTIGNNLMVSSLKENKIALFEITADTVVMTSDNEFLAVTNHFQSEYMSSLYGATTYSKKRKRYLDLFYTKSKTITPDNIMLAMSHFDGGLFDWSTVANKGTVQSVVFFPGKRMLFIAKGTETPVTMGGYVMYDYDGYVK
jgi:predicted choloylglycine hydrolase